MENLSFEPVIFIIPICPGVPGAEAQVVFKRVMERVVNTEKLETSEKDQIDLDVRGVY